MKSNVHMTFKAHMHSHERHEAYESKPIQCLRPRFRILERYIEFCLQELSLVYNETTGSKQQRKVVGLLIPETLVGLVSKLAALNNTTPA
jgi:hypothetical protein